MENELEFTKGDQESIKEAINNGIEELSTDGIDGWRLPTLDELKYIKANLETINSNLETLNKDIFDIGVSNSWRTYYF